MKRISLDKETPDVRRFIQQLPLEGDGVELELEGRLICKIVPSNQLTVEAKESLVQERWQLIRRAQQRNAGAPAKVIEREIQDAVEEVRRRKK